VIIVQVGGAIVFVTMMSSMFGVEGLESEVVVVPVKVCCMGALCSWSNDHPSNSAQRSGTYNILSPKTQKSLPRPLYVHTMYF